MLRFNPVPIGDWLDELLARKIVQTKTELSQYVGCAARPHFALSLRNNPRTTWNTHK